MPLETKPYRVLLYYKYAVVENPELWARQHLKFCKELGLKGRIIVAPEGINGTVSGPVEATEVYMRSLASDPQFSGIEFKIDEAEGHVFRKIFVRARQEIVTMSLPDDVNPAEGTGEHLEPEAFYREILRDDVIVVDA